MFRLQQSRAAILLTIPEVTRWNNLTGGDGFSATCWLVHTMGLARRWPELTGEVALGSLDFSFEQMIPIGSRIEFDLFFRQKHQQWSFYSFKARETEKEFFNGTATLFSGVKNSKQSHPFRAPIPGKNLLSRMLDSEDISRYLELSGDGNPVHRREAGAAVCPGLLLLGYAEASLKSTMGISLASSPAVQVRYRNPAFAGEWLDLNLIPGNHLHLQMSVADRLIATITVRG